MSHVMVCEVCGDGFEAKRSDARTCSGACRQKKRRRGLDVVRVKPERDIRGRGEWHRTSVERLERFIDTSAGGYLGAELSAEALRLLDVDAAVGSPDAPLEEWDERLTGRIRLLSSLRRAIRDARRA